MNSQTTPETVSPTSAIVSLAGEPPRFDATDRTAQRVLRALFELGLGDCPADAGTLARLLSLRPSLVAQYLVRLDGLGLVRADRARLTLVGLATAARLPALVDADGVVRRQRQEVRARTYASRANGLHAAGAQGPLAVRDACVLREHVPSASRPIPSPLARPRARVARPRASIDRLTIRTGPSSVSL